MKAIFTLLATTAVAAATSLSGRTGQELAQAAPPTELPTLAAPGLFSGVTPAPALAQGPVAGVAANTATLPVLDSLFAAQAVPAPSPSPRVPMIAGVPMLGNLFTQPPVAAVQDPEPKVEPRPRRRASGTDEQREAELQQLKARLADVEQQLAERERAADAERSGKREKRADQTEPALERLLRARVEAQADESATDEARRALEARIFEHMKNREALTEQTMKQHEALLELLAKGRHDEAMAAAEKLRAEAVANEKQARRTFSTTLGGNTAPIEFQLDDAQEQAKHAQALAEHARKQSVEAQARDEHRATRKQREAEAQEVRKGAVNTLRGLGYVDTTPEGAADNEEWRRLDADVENLARSLHGLEQGQLVEAREKLEAAQATLKERRVEGTVLDPTGRPLETRVARGRVAGPLARRSEVPAETADPTPRPARERARGQALSVPSQPDTVAPPAALDAPQAVTAPVAPRMDAPAQSGGRSVAPRARRTPTPAPSRASVPGGPSTPAPGGGGGINIHVENGDVHIHGGGGGGISVDGADPFSADTTRARGEKDRVSGFYRTPGTDEPRGNADPELPYRYAISRNGDRFNVSMEPDGSSFYRSGSQNVPGAAEAYSDLATKYVQSVQDDFARPGTASAPGQAAQTWETYASGLAGAPDGGTQAPVALENYYRAKENVLLDTPADGAPSVRGQALDAWVNDARGAGSSLDELLQLVREVHADVRALREEMQTLRSEVERAPRTGMGAPPDGSAGGRYDTGGGASTPYAGGGSSSSRVAR